MFGLVQLGKTSDLSKDHKAYKDPREIKAIRVNLGMMVLRGHREILVHLLDSALQQQPLTSQVAQPA